MVRILLLLVCLFPAIPRQNPPKPPDKGYLLGKFNPQSDARFSRILPHYASGSALGGFLRKETWEAFVRMADAADKDGVKLAIISATRNFDSQKKIWENKWSGKVLVEGRNLSLISDLNERAKIILRYSAMPGTSRHHWGTDMDINSLGNSYFESGPGLKAYQWLKSHAADFGFCQPYTSKAGGRTGYEEEKWHWSYLPLGKIFLRDFREIVRYTDITGFQGSETAPSLKIIEEYVQDVSCK